MERVEREVPTAGFVVLGAGALAAIGARATWLDADIGNESIAVQGADLHLVGWLAVTLGVAVATSGLVQGVIRRQARNEFALVCSTVLATTSAITILVLEAGASLIPTGALPTLIRRTTFQVGAGLGIWIVFLASATTVVVSSGRLSSHGVLWRSTARPTVPGRRFWAMAAYAVGAFLIGFGRYAPAASAKVGTTDVELAGWAVPWIGPGTLVGLWLIVVCGTFCLLRRSSAVPLVGVCAAWAVAFLASVSAILVDALARTRLAQRLPDGVPARVQRNIPSPSVGLGTWLVLVGAAVVIVAATALYVCDRRPSQRSRSE